MTQLVDVARLNRDGCRFKFCQGYAEMEQQWLGRFIPFKSVSAILTSVTQCWCGSTVEQLFCKQSVAGSNPVTSSRCECGAVASIPGFQPGDTSSSLVFRSNTRMWCKGKHRSMPISRCEFLHSETLRERVSPFALVVPPFALIVL